MVLAVAGALMQRTFRPNADARGLVADIAAEPRDRHAFVVLHSIDGPGACRVRPGSGGQPKEAAGHSRKGGGDAGLGVELAA